LKAEGWRVETKGGVEKVEVRSTKLEDEFKVYIIIFVCGNPRDLREI
jgi:hypothetical protein